MYKTYTKYFKKDNLLKLYVFAIQYFLLIRHSTSNLNKAFCHAVNSPNTNFKF